MEIWKDVTGYEGSYQVSDQGRIKSLNYGRTGEERILKPGKDGNGYPQVILYNNGKNRKFKVHRLVAQAFIPNPNNWSELNHLDEDKTNNCADNLEWCDRKYNCNYGTRNKRSTEKRSIPVIATVILTGEVEFYPSAREAGRRLNYSDSGISKALKGKYKYACKRTWRYA